MITRVKHLLYITLRATERFTKTDMVYLVRGGSWLVIGQIVTTVASLLLAIVLANVLPKETYGIYRYVLSAFAILTMATLPGLNSALARAIARGDEGVLIPGVAAKIRYGVSGSVVSLAIGIYYLFHNNQTDLALAFILLSLFIPLFDSLDAFQAYLIGKKRFPQITFYAIITRITQVVLIGLTAWLSHNALFIIVAYFLPPIAIRIIYFMPFLGKAKSSPETTRETIHYGKRLTVSTILGVISNQLDTILLFNLLGPVALATYSLALAPLEQLKSYLKQLDTLALPKFSQQEKTLTRKTLQPKILKLCGILTIVSFIYILLAPYAYRLLFPQYLDAVIYSQVFSISIIALPLFIVNAAFEGQMLTNKIYRYQAITSIFQIITTVVLIYFYGIWGAIVARMLYRFFSLFYSLRLLKN